MLRQIEIGGFLRPIHFGLWALKTIAQELGIDQSKILGGLFVTEIEQQIAILRIGLQEGEKKYMREYRIVAPLQTLQLTDEDVAAWLDDRPAALDEGVSLYFEQAYGEKLEAVLEKMEKVPELAAETENLKNAWAKVKQITGQLPSLASKK